MTTRGVPAAITMRSRFLFGVVISLLCLASGCDLKVTSIATRGPGVLSAVKGEWRGTWLSGDTGQSGSLTLRIQEFDQQPVVAATFTNACLLSPNYQLVMLGESVTLQLDGIPILVAQFTSTDQLVGSYSCQQDSGTWSAARLGSLPDPLDLSGTWQGTAMIAGVAEYPVLVELEQFVRNGRIELEGFAELQGLLPFQLPLAGNAIFRTTNFELVLQTNAGFEPSMVFAGIGDREPLQVGFGLIQTLGAQAAPFQQAAFQIAKHKS